MLYFLVIYNRDILFDNSFNYVIQTTEHDFKTR
ncbi:hypothetical protein Lederberg_43 [Pelagibacter phage Lederberg EXVC029P]|nr:hypothetical protein Lederberg_43 [Pelagibacter phage Lederberg EXVC029P]